MYLSQLQIRQFKNIELAWLNFSPSVNVLHGRNGAGKTNVLDAIYYLSVCKSYFPGTSKEAVRYGAEKAVLFGRYTLPDPRLRREKVQEERTEKPQDGLQEEIACVLRATGEKALKRNGREYRRLSEHLGLLPIVMVSPQDASLVYGTGEERRRYMNFLLSQTQPSYVAQLNEYQKLLKGRNTLLKNGGGDPAVLEAVEQALCVRANALYLLRSELCTLLQPYVQTYYNAISQGAEEVTLHYRSDLAQGPMEVLLERYRQRDQVLQYTSAGVQRDELEMELNGHALRICGSQGQQKTYLLALKLAQFALLRKLKGAAPLLLLDDLFDKLDNRRVEALMQLVAQEDFGQLFITHTQKALMQDALRNLSAPCAYYSVLDGVVSPDE